MAGKSQHCAPLFDSSNKRDPQGGHRKNRLPPYGNDVPQGQNEADAVGVIAMAALKKLNILVTNDDGESEGLRILLSVAKRFGNAYAIIPNRQRSAVSGALTLHKPLRLHKIDNNIYTLSGTPADCVIFANYSGEFPKPDLVLSGINPGDNTGMESIFGSGTIGACWQSVLEGAPAIAFSIKKGKRQWHEKKWGNREGIMRKTAELVKELMPMLSKETFFSVNMPEEPEKAKIIYTNEFQTGKFITKVTKREDPDGISYYWISGAARKGGKGTDTWEVLENGNITISELSLEFFKGE